LKEFYTSCFFAFGEVAKWIELTTLGYLLNLGFLILRNKILMPLVLLMEFNKETRQFQSLREVELLSVPTSGDKVVIDIDGIGFIFKVYDVHYADKKLTDVNVIRISTITDYNASRFPDIENV